MNPLPDPRLAELFVRYWENTLSSDDLDELQNRLAADSEAREEFQTYCVQAVCVRENSIPPAAISARSEARWSRRRMLRLLAGGTVAGVAAGLVGYRYWGKESPSALRVLSTHGDVSLRTLDGKTVAAEGFIPLGGIVSTVGASSSAVLQYPDGTNITLTGDSAISVSGPRKLTLLRGTATAQVAQQANPSDSLTLATSEASVSRLSGVALTLARAIHNTEIGVQSGRVSVADASGEPLEIVHSGEYLTVRSDGLHRKKAIEPTPDEFKWDLSKPLPEGWNVGVRETPIEGPIVRPVLWFDPYHKAEMFQIRSDHQWARGFVRLTPDSKFRVRYWVNRPAPSQLCLCVRTDNSVRSDTGMLECNDAFAAARPREWQWLEVRAGDMLRNKHAPNFGAPWVPFLIIFNSYQEDIGLKIADFRVV